MNSKRSDYVRESELIREIVPFSHASLWRFVKRGTFPAPIKLSERITAWERKAVMDWIQAKAVAVKEEE